MVLEDMGIHHHSRCSFLELQDSLKTFFITICPEDTRIINYWPHIKAM